MTIQWFPGHMAKARREVSEKLKLVDIVFELVDARLPVSSRNPMIDEIILQKPRLMILNKADLADSYVTKLWSENFLQKQIVSVAVNAKDGKNMHLITEAAKKVLAPKRDKLIAKGVRPRAIRAMIIGIPNVGKSTLINRIAKKNIAKTGNSPGVTKAQQWIKVDKEIDLLDTPGILWPKFSDEEIGFKLALTGAIKDAILNLHDIAYYGLSFFGQYYPQKLMSEYNLTKFLDDPHELLEHIGKVKYYKTSAVIDIDKTALKIVTDIRSGKLGTFSLERPKNN